MNKAELVTWLQDNYKDQFPSKAQAERGLAALVDAVKAGLGTKDGKVQLVGFGTFEVRERKARTGRNPQTGATIKIPASKTVTFRPGKTLKASLTAGKNKSKK